MDNITKKQLEITICMGSSCFSRGGNEILDAYRTYIDNSDLSATIQIKGTLCKNACSKGPNVTIDGTEYHNVNPVVALDLLKHHLSIVQ